MKNKIIFLDIDGVLNGYNFFTMFGWRLVCLTHSKKLKEKYRDFCEPFGIHERKVKRLSKIVEKTNAKIVLSSSWRKAIIKYDIDKMDVDDDNPIKQLLLLFKKYNIEIIGSTPRDVDGVRQNEIDSYLYNNYTDIESFVILDDESFDLKRFVGKELVLTSSKKVKMITGHWSDNTGLKNKHVRKAIKILNERKDVIL